MKNLKEQVLKLKIVFAKMPVLKNTTHYKSSVQELKEPIKPYKTITGKSNIYLKIEDRLFYSPTLSLMYKVQQKEVKENLKRYILEGITISETAIETIIIKTKIGTYHINDVYEIVSSEELKCNFKDL